MPEFYDRRWSIDIDNKPFIVSSKDSVKCVFEVNHEFGGVISYMKIGIYNLSSKTIGSKIKNGAAITLRAGYKNNIDVIGEGVIINSYMSRFGADTVVNLICASSAKKPSDFPTISFTAEKGTSIASVIQTVCEKMKLTLVINKNDFKDLEKLKSGTSFSGDGFKIINDLSHHYEFDYTVANKTIFALKHGKTFNETPQVISQETGMEDMPEFTDTGYNVKSRLNPKFKIGHKLRIKSTMKVLNFGAMHFRNVPETTGKGVYKIYKIVINGDTHGKTWTSKLSGYIDDYKRGLD